MESFFIRVFPPRTRRFLQYRNRVVWQKRTLVKALGRAFMEISKNVEANRNETAPIVALGSALYTHVWSYPDNLHLAFELQDRIRSTGSIPATIGIVDGVAKIGLTDEEIISLCLSAGKPETMMVSRGDLPFVLGMGIAGRPIMGGTTLSCTAFLARWAGINVLGTDGLGDLCLYEKEEPWSLSADLMEIGRTPIAIICSGCKSYFNTERTLAFLKAQGIMIATYADGRDGIVDFPEFYSRNSGITSPKVFSDLKEAAAIIFSLAKIGTRGNRFTRSGVVLVNPVSEELSIPNIQIAEATNQAISEAANLGLRGHQATHILLKKIKEFTNSRSLLVNRASITSNILMASKVAGYLSSFWKQETITYKETDKLKFNEVSLPSEDSLTSISQPHESKISKALDKIKILESKNINQIDLNLKKFFALRSSILGEAKVNATRINKLVDLEVKSHLSPDIAVFGAVAIDQVCNLVVAPNAAFNFDLQPYKNSSNISRIEHRIGGVGHNLALAAHLVGTNQHVKLCSLVGDDIPGVLVLDSLKSSQLDISGIKVLPQIVDRSGVSVPNRTAQYVAINDAKKDLVLGMTDMQIFRHNSYNCPKSVLKNLKWAIIDANWNRKTVRGLMSMLRVDCPRAKIVFAPVDEQKGADIFRTSGNPGDPAGEIPNTLTVFPNHKIDLVTLSIGELKEIFCAATANGYFNNSDHWHVLNALGILETQYSDSYRAITGEELTEKDVPFQSIQLLPYMPTLLIRLCSHDILLIELLKIGDPRLRDKMHDRWIVSRTHNGHMYIGGVYMRRFPSVEQVDPADIINSTGARNTFLGVLVAGLSKGATLDSPLINIAQKAANMTSKSEQAVCPSLGELAFSLDKVSLDSTCIREPNSNISADQIASQRTVKNSPNGSCKDIKSRFISNLNSRAKELSSNVNGLEENSLPVKYGLPEIKY